MRGTRSIISAALYRYVNMALGLWLALAGASAALAAEPFRLQILHVSDLEGDISALQEAPRFAAVVQALERDAQSRNIASVLVSAGDNYLLGPFFYAAADPAVGRVLGEVLIAPRAQAAPGRLDIGVMNVLGFDASALGNHEFDPGTLALRRIIAADAPIPGQPDAHAAGAWPGARFPYLAANLDTSRDPHLGPLHVLVIGPGGDAPEPGRARIADAALLVRGGQHIGIVGAVTPRLGIISSPGATTIRGETGNDMRALAAVLQPAIDRVVELGANKVLLLSHLQDLELERALVSWLHEVDVVIGGGSETVLADESHPLRSGDVRAGGYPQRTYNADGDPAMLLSTAGRYRYVGRLVLSFDDHGRPLPESIDTAESRPYPTDEAGVQALWMGANAFAPGSKAQRVRRLTRAVSQVVKIKDARHLGRTDVFLEGRRYAVRSEETNLGSLVADAVLDAAHAIDPRIRVALMNGGGIRAPIGAVDETNGELLPPRGNPVTGKPPRVISALDVENSLRFNNGLTALSLNAAQLKQALEYAVAASGPGTTPGRFPQVAGLRFSYDPRRPVWTRIRSVAVGGDGGKPMQAVVSAGRILNTFAASDRRIRIVMSRFIADGGDGYPFPSMAASDPGVQRVELRGASDDAAGGPAAGTEQHALMRYLRLHHAEKPFAVADTEARLDRRIQNLSLRDDQVLPIAARAKRVE